MSGLNVSLKTSPEWRDAAGRWARVDVGNELAAMAQAWGRTALANLQQATPVRSGETRRAWRADWIPSQNAVKVTNKRPTIPWLLEGTKPHDIGPKEPGGVLRWLDAGGEPVFARGLIHHPGTRPSSELVAAVERLGHDADVALQETGAKILKQLAGG